MEFGCDRRIFVVMQTYIIRSLDGQFETVTESSPEEISRLVSELSFERGIPLDELEYHLEV